MQVYEVSRTIPAGETLTYGDVAKRLGDKKLAQAVGRALGQKPIPHHCALSPGDRRKWAFD